MPIPYLELGQRESPIQSHGPAIDLERIFHAFEQRVAAHVCLGQHVGRRQRFDRGVGHVLERVVAVSGHRVELLDFGLQLSSVQIGGRTGRDRLDGDLVRFEGGRVARLHFSSVRFAQSLGVR